MPPAPPALQPAPPVQDDASPPSPRPRVRWELAAGLLLIAVLWGRLFWSLAPEWEIDPQYAHGWFIPVLAGILAYLAWQHRPDPRPPRWRGLIIIAAVLLLLPLGPLAFLQTVYPEARPFQWVHALIAAGATVMLIWAYGGKGWVRCFLFPIVFAFLAVPWPRALQNTVTDRLMHGVASVAVEITLLAGIPASQQGNTIALRDTSVGVDEACSGIRSLQGSIMVGLFLGAYFPMGMGARALLLGLALAGSLVLNVVRASVLTWVSAAYGQESLQRLHDPAGLAILGLVFLGALWAANALSSPDAAPVLQRRMDLRLLPRSSAMGIAAVAGIVWLFGTDAACRAWFDAKAPQPAGLAWRLDLQRAEGAIRDEPISAAARQFLRFESGQAKTIRGEDGAVTRLIHLTWEGGEISAAGVRTHSPAICLQAIGHQLDKSLPPVSVEVRGVQCIFNAYLFQVGDRPAYVYHAVWENGRAMQGDALDQSLKSAVKAVRERRRLSEAEVLLVMFTGPEDAGEAEARLSALMEKVLIVEADKS